MTEPAKNLKELLDRTAKLEQIRAALENVGLDTLVAVDAVNEVIRQAQSRAGALVFPQDAAQSQVIDYNSQNLRFNRQSGQFEVIKPISPLTILLDDSAPAVDNSVEQTKPETPADNETFAGFSRR